MKTKTLFRAAASLLLSIYSTACIFDAKDSAGSFRVLDDGSIQLAKGNAVDEMQLTGFFLINGSKVSLQCASLGGFKKLHEAVISDNLYKFDFSKNSSSQNDFNSCLSFVNTQGEYKKLYVTNNKYLPILTASNMACILGRNNKGVNDLSRSSEECLKLDDGARDGANLNAGLHSSPMEVNELKVFLSKSIPNVNLAHLYEFNEASGLSTDDALGASNGVLINGASFVSGLFGNAVQFDGINDGVDLGAMNISGNQLSLSAYIKPLSFGYYDARIVSKATGVNEQEHNFMLSTMQSNGQHTLRFRLKTQGVTSTLIASSGIVNLNKYNHVAAVYDGANMKLFLNGNEVGSMAKSGAVDSGSAKTTIGINPDGNRPFHGMIDRLEILNSSLSSQEIAARTSACAECVGVTVTPTPTPPISVEPTALISWDANTEPDLVGYILTMRDSVGSDVQDVHLNNLVPVDGRVQQLISDLTPGVTYFFSVRAKNSSGDISSYSSEVSKSISN